MLLALLALLVVGLLPNLRAQFSREQSVGRTLRLTLHPWGFEPSEITLAPGPIAIEVRNRVGFQELDLKFEFEASEGQSKTNLLQERYQRERPKWRNVFVLSSGTYIVSAAPHEKWVARINVKGEAERK
jgi:hypothetical protein